MNINNNKNGFLLRHVLVCLTLLCLGLLFAQTGVGQNKVTKYSYKVIASYPHSKSFFTQGIEFYQGQLYEGSGLRGKSKVIIRTLDSAIPIKQTSIRKNLFGEGITILNDRLYQLTWQSGRGFIYNAQDLTMQGEFKIPGQGWGLTNNGQQLIYSNGSSRLMFLNPKTFKVEKTITVRFEGSPVESINELEWVEGLIYANIWQSNWVIIIDPDSGQVTGKVRLNTLLPNELRSASTDVLNGIAYDKIHRRLFFTGKNWPRIFHVELIPASIPGT